MNNLREIANKTYWREHNSGWPSKADIAYAIREAAECSLMMAAEQVDRIELERSIRDAETIDDLREILGVIVDKIYD